MDLRKIENRVNIISEINTPENKKRKDDSFICNEVYNGRLRQYVIEYLCTLFHRDTVKEMPVQSGCHLTKKIVKERATIYSEKVKRNFEEVSDEQLDVLEGIYKDANIDFLLGKANEFFVLQNQVMLYMTPYEGELKLKVLKMHHFDVILAENDPTEMIGIVISSYDKRFKRDDKGNFNPLSGGGTVSRPHASARPDGIDQTIADEDDSTDPNSYEVWTKRYTDPTTGEVIPALQFVMTKDGEIISEDPLSPIDILPVCDISGYKDHQFYAEDQKSMTDFTIEFNALNSELAQMFRMNYGQAVLSGPESLLPRDNEFTVGPNRTLVLKEDADIGKVTFDFVSPQGQISNGIEYLEMLLAQFLSSIGIDPKVVSKESGQTFSSGIERLLSMIERHSATKNDYALFEQAEKNLLKIIKAYLNAYQGTDVLKPKYNTAPLSEYCELTVNYAKPEGATTLKEKIEQQEKLMSLGLANRTTAVKELYGFDQAEAEEYIKKIDEERNIALETIAQAQQEQTQE